MTFPDLVAAELERARKMHPPHNSHHESKAVIEEELEEYWEWVKRKKSLQDRTEMLKELVQVAAMAQRAAEDNGLVE